MKRCLALLFLAFLTCSCAVGRYARGPESADIEAKYHFDGVLRAVNYHSSEKMLTERRMLVYLPIDYFDDTTKRYPVLYLLHGARGNEVTWLDSSNVIPCLDSLRRIKEAEHFIVVLPNMNRYYSDKDYNNGHCLRAMRAFWLIDGEVERHFMTDVVDFTDSHFRTIPEKSSRAIAGMSSGALQALYLSADYPDAFDYVGLFSPYTYATFAAVTHLDVYGALGKKLKLQFADPPKVYGLYIGNTDFFYPHIRIYDRKLTEKGYSHTFTVCEGGHEWYNWSAFATDFNKKLFK
jgi:enterochelin esterase family protein